MMRESEGSFQSVESFWKNLMQNSLHEVLRRCWVVESGWLDRIKKNMAEKQAQITCIRKLFRLQKLEALRAVSCFEWVTVRILQKNLDGSETFAHLSEMLSIYKSYVLLNHRLTWWHLKSFLKYLSALNTSITKFKIVHVFVWQKKHSFLPYTKMCEAHPVSSFQTPTTMNHQYSNFNHLKYSRNQQVEHDNEAFFARKGWDEAILGIFIHKKAPSFGTFGQGFGQ